MRFSLITHRLLPGAAALGVTLLVGACQYNAGEASDPDPGRVSSLQGQVRSGNVPLVSSAVTLYRAGTAIGESATPLASTETDAQGRFEIVYDDVASADDVLYLLAEGGTENVPTAQVTEQVQPGPALAHPRQLTLASVLGTGRTPANVVINERTTVASAYGMAQFTNGRNIAGPTPGLPNAAGMVRNLVDLTTGEAGSILSTPPNGEMTSTMRTFNSLANMIASCAVTPTDCNGLLGAATLRGRSAPANTFEAVTGVARDPAASAGDLFALSTFPGAPYAPALERPPSAWTLALRFDGDGRSIDGPGNFAIDHEGNVWVTTNYEYNPDPTVPVCASNILVKFTPTGQYAPGSPYTGGGLSGAGYGIDIDPYGDIWVGNFGFAGEGCPPERQPPHNSISKFHPDGTPLSPPAGFTQGGINWPQGLISDPEGNIWIANCHANTVTLYPRGEPEMAKEIRGLGLVQPFALVDNGTGNVFVTGIVSHNVAVLRRDGSPARTSPISGGGLSHPMGIAADSRGNMWVANSGVIDLPCPDQPKGVPPGTASITLLGPDGQPLSASSFTGGGLTMPWGIAVDGNDNVWVANFEGRRLSHFCGTDPSACPPGARTGDPISPDGTGYAFDGFERSTAVAIDPSGNVWATNNWMENQQQTNPGGHQVVVYVGIAGPVQRLAPRPRLHQ